MTIPTTIASRRPRTLRLAALAAGLAFAGLASAQVLEIAADGSPAGLDPHVVPAFNTVLINKNIYEGLTAIDKDLKIVPSLATSWTISKDGLSYRFKLKPGIKFHNGKPMSAADVVASLSRVRDTKTGSPYAARLSMVNCGRYRRASATCAGSMDACSAKSATVRATFSTR